MLEMGEHATSSAPRRRWDLLSKAFEELKTGCSTSEKQPDTLRIVNNAATTRRFHGFGLFSREDVVIDGEQWIRVTSRKDFAIEGYAATAYSAGEEHAGSDTVGTSSGSFELFLRKEAAVCLTDLTGFDNTGNICIWPAEEVMAFWCLGNPSLFRGKRICELGGGMASLGGNVIACTMPAEMLLLTDGNEKCCANCEAAIAQNRKRQTYSCENVSSRRLRWDVTEDYRCLAITFDVVIAADCVFKAEYHEALCRCIRHILKNDGIAIIFAPKRGNTLTDFVTRAKEYFEVLVSDRYSEDVFSLHEAQKTKSPEYSENLNYPLQVKLRIK